MQTKSRWLVYFLFWLIVGVLLTVSISGCEDPGGSSVLDKYAAFQITSHNTAVAVVDSAVAIDQAIDRAERETKLTVYKYDLEEVGNLVKITMYLR